MKKLTSLSPFIAITGLLGLSNPIYAQTAESPSTTTRTTDDHDDGDESGKWD